MSEEIGSGEPVFQFEPLDLTVAKLPKPGKSEKEIKALQSLYRLENTRKWINASEFTEYLGIDKYPGTSGYNEENNDKQESEMKRVSQEDLKVKVVLMHPQLWNEFNHVQNEMIINKNGRQMFPKVEVLIDGLHPERFYSVSLQIVPADDMRYRFTDDTWKAQGIALWPLCKKASFHPCSPSKGSFWMNDAIAFRKVKLSNWPSLNPDTIQLNTMQKYMAKVNVYLLKDDCHDMVKLYNFDLPETNFIAVTAYQNNAVTNLKISHNPFAKGFRLIPRSSGDYSNLHMVRNTPTSIHLPTYQVSILTNDKMLPKKRRADSESLDEEQLQNENSQLSMENKYRRRFETHSNSSTFGMNFGPTLHLMDQRNFAKTSHASGENIHPTDVPNEMFVEMAPWHKEEFRNA